jgi:phage baseplate assembly protein W
MAIKKLVIKPTATTMNYGVRTAHVYKGFSSSKASQNFKIYDIECIKQDIINHFSTRKGERVMNPTYGTIIWDAIFEPLTEDLRNAISDDIKQIIQNDPRVIAEDIKVDEFQSGILLEITLRYQTENLSSVLKLTFDKELGLITE